MTDTKYDIYAIGNALLDVEYHVSEALLNRLKIDKGLMTLIDAKQLQTILQQLPPQADHVACGGSAANTVATATHFGAKCFLSCRIADDKAGHCYYDNLKATGITSNLLDKKPGITGKCLALITEDGERSMLSYLGITSEFHQGDIFPKQLINSHYLYIEGYLITNNNSRSAMRYAKDLAISHQVKTVLSLSDPAVVKAFHSEMQSIIGEGVDIIFCNQFEAMSYCRTNSLDEAKKQLVHCAPNIIITLGAQGSWIYANKQWEHIEAYTSNEVDSIGAGDTFAGSYLHGLSQGMSAFDAADLASYTASKVVAQLGPRLTKKTIIDIKKKLTEFA